MSCNDKSVVSEYISAACNSTHFAADWGPHDKICIAVDNGVAIMDSDLELKKGSKITNISFAHRSRVNVVKWIRGYNCEKDEFVSGSVDGTVIVWLCNEFQEYIPRQTLTGHEEAVTDVDAASLELPSGGTCVFIASLSLNYLKLWRKSNYDENFMCYGTFQQSHVGLGISGVSLALLPGSNSLILASPKKFTEISIFTSSLNRKEENIHSFVEVFSLAGHTNWINDISFTTINNDSALLMASASHDNTIRIWRVTYSQSSQKEFNLREHAFSVESKNYVITLRSILHGHDHWVYSVQWKYFDNVLEKDEKLKLLSVSADKTVLVWKRDRKLKTWVEQYRLGDVSNNSATFLGGRFNSSGKFIFCHDLSGSFHVWQYEENSDNWFPFMLPSGHSEEVTDIQWDPMGQFLMSVSSDKTCRLHAPWKTNPEYWYEIARPQTHGYVISCLAILPQFRFISGATEKELRFFMAPKSFIRNFKNTSLLKFNIDDKRYPHNSAVLPSLNLSNKSTDEVENINIDILLNKDEIIQTRSSGLPSETDLSQNTLWPEIQKLYHHPNEISCVTCNYDGNLLASSCKANSSKEACIVIWAVKNWDYIEKTQELNFHQLTVTHLSFSPNGIFLLSVSRDRTWSLFTKNRHESFELISYTNKTNAVHKRQLHCCCWSHDSKYFVTGSRDGKVVIWLMPRSFGKLDKSPLNGVISQCIIPLNDDIRSVSLAPDFVIDFQYLLAIGCGSGMIELHVWNTSGHQKWLSLQNHDLHQKAVTKVTFCPILKSTGSSHKNILRLASSGSDRLVRIYALDVTQF